MSCFHMMASVTFNGEFFFNGFSMKLISVFAIMGVAVCGKESSPHVVLHLLHNVGDCSQHEHNKLMGKYFNTGSPFWGCS